MSESNQPLFHSPPPPAAAAAAAAGSPAAAAAMIAATKSLLDKLNSSHALNPPPQVELRTGGGSLGEPGGGGPGLQAFGVWAVEEIPAATRYGPFLGKWTLEPADKAFAWEVRESLLLRFPLQICTPPSMSVLCQLGGKSVTKLSSAQLPHNHESFNNDLSFSLMDDAFWARLTLLNFAPAPRARGQFARKVISPSLNASKEAFSSSLNASTTESLFIYHRPEILLSFFLGWLSHLPFWVRLKARSHLASLPAAVSLASSASTRRSDLLPDASLAALFIHSEDRQKSVTAP